ncbi:MAG: leucine-rich repeat domain-containing protein [Treponema sp.]|jgi:hypothetical protein|nr:leucine-rich repeat domain-containing protein [Treponema sp.]
MLKKRRSLFVIMIFFGAALFAQSEDDFDILQNRAGGITITGYRGTEKNIVIPGTIGGMKVTIIGLRAFFNKSLTGVTIPETVAYLESQAFAGNQLNALTILNCVIIGYGAFADNQLTELALPDGAATIGPMAFARNQLAAVVIPGSVIHIGNGAFAGNPLVSVTIGANRNIDNGQGFDPSFVNYYASAGKKAGTYSKENRVWTRRPDLSRENPDGLSD